MLAPVAMVTLAVPDCSESSALMATICTASGDGAAPGAVYVRLASTAGHHANLPDRAVSVGDAVDGPGDGVVCAAEHLGGERHAVKRCECSGGGREAYADASLNGH